MPIRGETTKRESPVQKYLSRKKGEWIYWDGEKNETFDLKEFVVLKTGYTIKGFDAKNKCGFRSNEIEYFTEPFQVHSGKNGVVFEGVYKEIKEKLVVAGGKLHLAVTVLAGDELVEFFIKGKSFYNFSEFLKKIDQQQTKIKFTGAVEMKDAQQPYFLPSFEVGSSITKKEATRAQELANELIEYRDSLKGTTTEENLEPEEDDLPF